MPINRYLPQPGTVIHLLLTFVLGWWSFILIQPGDSFATTPALSAFGRVATEDHWACGLALLSACGATGLIWRKFYRLSLYILAFGHGLISFTILFSNLLATGAGTYGALMICAWYLLVKDHE